MNERLPDWMSEHPNDKLMEQTYVFQVEGEIEVEAYSKEDAELRIEEELRELVSDAYRKGSIEIK